MQRILTEYLSELYRSNEEESIVYGIIRIERLRDEEIKKLDWKTVDLMLNKSHNIEYSGVKEE